MGSPILYSAVLPLGSEAPKWLLLYLAVLPGTLEVSLEDGDFGFLPPRKAPGPAMGLLKSVPAILQVQI